MESWLEKLLLISLSVFCLSATVVMIRMALS